MVLALLLVVVLTGICVLFTLQPSMTARRLDQYTSEQLDDVRRTLTYLAQPAIPLSGAVQAGAAGVVGLALGRPSGTWWILVAILAVVLAGVLRSSIPRTERVLRDAGATDHEPGSVGADHRRRQVRWMVWGLWLFSVGRAAIDLSELDSLALALAPGIVLTLLGMVMLAVFAWRGLRGPHREPLWYRGD